MRQLARRDGAALDLLRDAASQQRQLAQAAASEADIAAQTAASAVAAMQPARQAYLEFASQCAAEAWEYAGMTVDLGSLFHGAVPAQSSPAAVSPAVDSASQLLYTYDPAAGQLDLLGMADAVVATYTGQLLDSPTSEVWQFTDGALEFRRRSTGDDLQSDLLLAKATLTGVVFDMQEGKFSARIKEFALLDPTAEDALLAATFLLPDVWQTPAATMLLEAAIVPSVLRGAFELGWLEVNQAVPVAPPAVQGDPTLAPGQTYVRPDGTIVVGTQGGGQVSGTGNLDSDPNDTEVMVTDPTLPAGQVVKKDLDNDGAPLRPGQSGGTAVVPTGPEDPDIIWIGTGGGSRVTGTGNLDSDPNDVEVTIEVPGLSTPIYVDVDRDGDPDIIFKPVETPPTKFPGVVVVPGLPSRGDISVNLPGVPTVPVPQTPVVTQPGIVVMPVSPIGSVVQPGVVLRPGTSPAGPVGTGGASLGVRGLVLGQ
jgi:hypothetical protein